jgi:hypothetical protein
VLLILQRIGAAYDLSPKTEVSVTIFFGMTLSNKEPLGAINRVGWAD